MQQPTPIKPLSAALSLPINRAYQASRFGLLLIFAGTVLLLAAIFIGHGLTRHICAIIGAAMVFFVLGSFYFQDFKKLKQAIDRIDRNTELVDAIQQTAIELTELAAHLQTLAARHANDAAVVIAQLRERLSQMQSRPLLSKIPGIEKIAAIAENKYMVRAGDVSTSIVKSTESARDIIQAIKNALIECDPNRLAKYLADLRELDKKTKILLSKEPKKTNAIDL